AGALTVAPGEIHALLGANGAGKSTMVKMLTGVIRPDGGTIRVRGQAVRLRSPRAAQKAGLAAVFQDPALAPDLTVLENLRLTGASVAAVRQWLTTMEIGDIQLRSLVSELPLPTLRMLDLARALAREPQLLLLDEITAALPADLAERVFVVMRRWRELGRSVLFISHRLAEVRAICDRATVLRDGVRVGVLDLAEGSEERIVELMLGSAHPGGPAPSRAPSLPFDGPERPTPLLEVSNLSLGNELHGVSFALGRGEVLGVAALEGQGQEALFDALSGRRAADAGTVAIRGKKLRLRQPYDAIRAGLVLVPADRLLALLPQRSVRENIALPRYNRVPGWGVIRQGRERSWIAEAVARLQIDTRAMGQVRRLSGGNQQKVTIARWVACGFDVLLCFDPTRGIDVGTKRQIYTLLRELANQGASVLLFTSELPEIQLACDRVLVLYEGRIVRELPAQQSDEATLLHAAHGMTHQEEAVS
ncbi:MAG TPA: sugar ABC transporter ATP-binding protein, partial [Chloroflexota bacterium]|nr:sugar ABC transporter ATP-binding protein [Chloroflexota bacterium]